MCEQNYHGVVRYALGWACWKTYLGRPERSKIRGMAMTELGNGLSAVGDHEAALSVREAELAMMQRIGASQDVILVLQTNLAVTYAELGRHEESISLERDVYSGREKLSGEEHGSTLLAANNYAVSLLKVKRFEEAKLLLRKKIPLARRVLGESHDLMLRMRKIYARALSEDAGATPDDLREAVTTLEETERTARRVLGGAHPLAVSIEKNLRNVRVVLGAREAMLDGDVNGIREAMAAMTPGGA